LSDVAAYLGVSPRTVRRLINDGELVAHRVRGRLRVSEADLATYLQQAQGAA
jgi:excisionase family DNA binding protein